MRFFHPGPNTDSSRFVPGASRRRRERFKKHKQELEAQRISEQAKALLPLSWDFWGSSGRILVAEPSEARPWSEERTEGALAIAQGCGYDPGNAAYRFHTAVNETTKHGSAFIRYGHTNPFCDLRQIDGDTQQREAKGAVYTADVIHSHVDYLLQARTGFKWRARPDQLVIRHYHGTRPGTLKQWPVINMLEDDLANVLLVGARLTLCAVRPSRMQWLPIAVPVKRYRNLVSRVRKPGPFRIAHSPTRADYKGTADLVAAVEVLRRKGLPIDLIMIERQRHDAALVMKAEADLTFDSFWLGIQGSGLEAAAMGQVVVAGDKDVKALYEQSEVGCCPYTFAGDRVELTGVIERAITDEKWRKAEAKRVNKYVTQYHDYAAVTKRYERIIADAMNRPDILTHARHVAA